MTVTTTKLGRNDPCWCGSGVKYKKCHLAADRSGGRAGQTPASSGPVPTLGRGREPDLSPPSLEAEWRGTDRRGGRRRHKKIRLKSREEIEGIRRACQLTRSILDRLNEVVREGATTGEIDRWIRSVMAEHGATPATLGYRGYPASSCISINEVVCHGIPGERPLSSGDIVNVDVTSILDGYYGDASRMYLVGDVDDDARRLVEVTRECLDLGVQAVRPGHTIGHVGHAIQRHAEAHGYSVVRQMVGHGVGLEFHEPPEVPHFGEPGEGPSLVPGMVFTIEPMINAGGWELEILDDGWTAVTKDRSLSAQWEHTVLVTPDGVDVLTA